MADDPGETDCGSARCVGAAGAGGDGADVFVLGPGQDTIEDFDFSEGNRLLVAGPQAEVNAVIASARPAVMGVQITTDDQGQVTLVGVAAGDVNADWFTTV
jgi:hypothetical protein